MAIAHCTSLSGEDRGSTSIAALHAPVMLAEVLEGLFGSPEARPAPRRFLDGTLGLGGHAEAVLHKAGAGAELLGLDRDSLALDLASRRLRPFGGAAHLKRGEFAGFEAGLEELGWELLDGALLDLGVSSLQLDSPERGFSFLHDGPLDMRMGVRAGEAGGESAADLVNRVSVQRLREILREYGEEPQAGRIARAIGEARARRPIESTLELAGIVERAYPAKWRATARRHPATRTFQALRMAVNDEPGQLRLFLERIVPRLARGGRLAIISFHSLEDRLVKRFFKYAASGTASLRLVTKKALEAGPEEVGRNSRARSAKLRVAERLEGKFSPPGPEFLAEANFKRGRKGR